MNLVQFTWKAKGRGQEKERMVVKLRSLQEMINGLIDYVSEQLPRIVPSS